MPDPQPAGGYQALWQLIHTGGLTVETYSRTTPGRPALRTLLQLDGDQLLSVDLAALDGLTSWERLRLAAQHNRMLRARMKALKSPALAVITWLRHLSLAGAGALIVALFREAMTLHLSFHSLAPALGSFALWALPRVAPALLRQRNAAFHEIFHAEQRAASQQVLMQLRRKAFRF